MIMGVLNSHSYNINLLNKCRSFSQLKQIHALLATSGLSNFDPFAWKILSFAATSPSSNIHYANRFFLQIANPTFFHYNALIRGFANSKNPIKSIEVFQQMLHNGIVPDNLTYPFLLKVSARLLDMKLGRCIHGHVLRNGYMFDLFIGNSLIHMYGSSKDTRDAQKLFDELPMKNLVSWNSILDGYAKCGNLEKMKEMFDRMPDTDVVSWSALVDGYVKDGNYTEALAVFEEMRQIGTKGNEVTMVSLLCACSHLGALEKGKEMNRYIVENHLPLTLILRTSLVDMYAKCGAIKEALTVFRGVSTKKTDVLIWNAMIGGLASHGIYTEALGIYREMQHAGIKPDEITYLCLLSACAHGGLVESAWEFFHDINKKGMVPKVEHYGCMIDVLARAGRLTEAYNFLLKMPVGPTASMLGALLSGCMNHRKYGLAEIIGKKLIELDPDHDGRYVGLSNVYAIDRRWDEARSTRKAMESRGVKKFPGFSYLEVFGALHRFVAHDELHPESKEIYLMLNIIIEHMKFSENTENLDMGIDLYSF